MKSVINLFVKPLEKFVKTESFSGVVLMFCAIFAMVIANSSASQQYFSFLETKFFNLSILHWINDALMAVFFFVVGLEIKREIVAGELSTLNKASLPILSALGGMFVPALFYWFFNKDGTGANGWAIPMATDIAFALGVLSLFGSRVSLNLKIFLLALAIVDDIGAVLVIAFFYTEEIKSVGLLIAGASIVAVFTAQFFKIKSYFVYTLIGVLVWYGILRSGVHATIAGVVLGLLTPYSFDKNKIGGTFSPVNELIHYLHPVVAFLIMPIFALANAGVSLRELDISQIFANNISIGIIFGLVLGKPIGIFGFSYLGVKLKLASLPEKVNWAGLFSVSCLAGIGFTMSIFISSLSLSSDGIGYAKIGIILASLISGFLGSMVLLYSQKKIEKDGSLQIQQ